MSQIFHEVDEEVRREHWVGLWKSYGGYLVAVLVLLVGSVAGYEIWQNHTTQAKEKATELLLKAAQPLDSKNYKGAVEALAAAAPQLKGDVKGLALLREAEARIGIQDITGAVANLDALSADTGISKSLRELAMVYSAYLQVDKAGFDEINSRMAPLAAENSAWRFSALELIGLSALSNHKPDVARQQFQAIANDATAPKEIRERAQTSLQAIASQAEDGK